MTSHRTTSRLSAVADAARGTHTTSPTSFSFSSLITSADVYSFGLELADEREYREVHTQVSNQDQVLEMRS